jgi:RNA polymerase sigma-70 factor (ECF subfamily)
MTVKNELASRLAASDIRAFNELYWKHYQAVYANIYRLLKDVAAAEDVLQDVFLTLWEKRSGLQDHLSVEGWLFSISFNKSVSYLKAFQKQQVSLKEKQSLDDAFTLPSDGSPVNGTDPMDQLQLAIEQLSPQKKKVFVMCKVEGKSYQEVADALQISKHTVKEYLSQSVSFIRDYLRKNEFPATYLLLLAAFCGQ